MDLKQKSTEELEKELEMISAINWALIGILSTLFVICIYGLFSKDDNGVFSALIVVPIALSAILPVNFSKIKKMKKELELRNN